jgi:hypothetical protein
MNKTTLLGIVLIDTNTLMTGSFIALFILMIVGGFLYNKFPQEMYFKYFILFPLFFLAGEILRTFRIVIPYIFSIVIANTLMVSGIIFSYIGVRAMLNLESQWHTRYYMPIAVVLFGFILFTYVHYNVTMRILIFSVFSIVYASSISWIFLKNATKEFKIFDYISSLLFLVGIIIFFVRTLKASMIEINVIYPKSTDLLNTFIYAYLFFISFWLSFILIIRAKRLLNNKNIINLEK